MDKKFSNLKIGIIGVGFVGSAIRKYFKSKAVKPFIYDKFKKLGSVLEVNRAEIVFICVPTPYNLKKGFDNSAVIEALEILKQPKIVVIKSSVIPGTTSKLQGEFPQHKILFNPEFLREVSAYKDMIKPDRQIVGYTKRSRKLAPGILKILPNAPYKKIMPSTEAEVVKYMANSFLALKVVFANQFYDICKALGVDYNLVKDGVTTDPRIGNSHFDISHSGYRGYGGSCFPKDVNAIIQMAESKKIKVELLKAMKKINRTYLKKSGLNEEFFLLNKHKIVNTRKEVA